MHTTFNLRGIILIMLVSYFLLFSTLLAGLQLHSAHGAGIGNAPADFKSTIAWVAQKNIPAVVHIEVFERQEIQNPFMPFENDPFFRYFFETPRMPKKYKRELRGLGTGMIIDAKGHILTNNHVVAGASKIQVLLASGHQYPAAMVGTDPKTDLAIIKISAKEQLPFVTFGDSDKIIVGDWVVAIGHPRGLDQTVTQGIISAKHRQGIIDPSSYQDFLQTDAAINPGNSGGPLLNLQGEVIGVNAAIMSQSGGFEGLGFAIPSNMALHVAEALISRGKVERGWIGVSVQELTPDLARSFNMEIAKGALISDVTKGGPAEKAGLKRGDVVIEYQGRNIPDAGTLRNSVAVSPVGQSARMTSLRNGEKKELTVTIGSLTDATKSMAVSVKDRLGAEVRGVSPKEAQRYGLESVQGVVIVWLVPNGSLARAGFEAGDMILEINGQAIESVENFIDIINALQPQQQVSLLALDHRTGGTGYVRVLVR